MSNPLSHVGQTPHPEVSSQVQEHCAQVQGQQQAFGAQGKLADQRPGGAQGPERADSGGERPATRLPQHPQQQQADPALDGKQRIRQQGETRAEDTSLPAPTDAD